MLKKLYLAFLLFIAILSEATFAQSKASEPLAAYKYQGKWYFINHSGREIFPPKVLEDVVGYSEGFFIVKYTDKGIIKNGVMNLKGEIVYTPDCDKLSVFSDSMAITIKYTDAEKTIGKYGFINNKGEQIIPNKYDGVSFFKHGLAFVSEKHHKAYIDRSGKVLIKLNNLVGNSFSEGLAVVNDDKYKFGAINQKGELVINCTFDELDDFNDGLARFILNSKAGYIDKTGKVEIWAQFDDAKQFSEGFASVAKSNYNGNYSWGFINKKGELISKDFKYELIREFSEQFASVRVDKFWTFVDNTGNYLFPPQYSYTENFKNGLAWVADKRNDRYGFMTQEGVYLFEIPKCEKIIDLRFNRRVFF